MSWKCRLINYEEMLEKGEKLQPGDMFYCDEDLLEIEVYKKEIISPEYFRDWYGKRLPIIIVLPNGHHWLIDSRFGGGVDGKRKEHGWIITGEIPNLTATPSINHLGQNGYHGWLKNGILSDDLEGRIYS